MQRIDSMAELGAPHLNGEANGAFREPSNLGQHNGGPPGLHPDRAHWDSKRRLQCGEICCFPKLPKIDTSQVCQDPGSSLKFVLR